MVDTTAPMSLDEIQYGLRGRTSTARCRCNRPFVPDNK